MHTLIWYESYPSHASHVPLQVLREMARVVRPGGKVLLLQHGRGSGWFERWVNERLDGGAAAHAAKWGCWWNRDILDLVGQVGRQYLYKKRISAAFLVRPLHAHAMAG